MPTLRPAVVRPGVKPYLVAHVALNRNILLQAAASAAGSLESGSRGGRFVNFRLSLAA